MVEDIYTDDPYLTGFYMDGANYDHMAELDAILASVPDEAAPAAEDH